MSYLSPNTNFIDLDHMYNHIYQENSENSLNENSISHFLNSNENFSLFNEILKSSQLQSKYDNLDEKLTLFVASNDMIDKNIINNLDVSIARHIILSSTIQNIIPSEILEYSPHLTYNTKNNQHKLNIVNQNGTTQLNNLQLISKDIICKNGIIHILNGIFI